MNKCSECKRSVFEPGIILVRTNPFGVDGIFKCESCAGKLADPLTQIVADALDGGSNE